MFAFLLAALAVTPLYNDDLPPTRFQGNAKPTVVITVADTNTDKTCGKAPEGWVVLACEFETKKHVPIILISNPCLWPEASDQNTYAHLLCHEFGHVNGWPNTHPQ